MCGMRVCIVVLCVNEYLFVHSRECVSNNFYFLFFYIFLKKKPIEKTNELTFYFSEYLEQIKHLLKDIQIKKKRDVYVLAAVISLFTILTYIYWSLRK